MRVIGGLLNDEYGLLLVAEALQRHGFDTYTVFGPEELFREPGTKPNLQRRLEEQAHSAGGTVDGISVNPVPFDVQDPSAQTVTEGLIDLGVPEGEADFYVSGLHQGRLLLLLRTKTGRAEEAKRLFRKHDAILPLE